MSLVESMDGTQCEKAHILYMDGMATIVIHVLDYCFVYDLFRLLAFLCSLAGLLCCLAQVCS